MKESVRLIIMGFVMIIIFIPLGLLPMLEKAPEQFKCPNPSPSAWIYASEKIKVPIEKMTLGELQITSTAMQIEASANIRADMHNMFSNLKGIGWAAVGILFAMFLHTVLPINKKGG